MTKKKHKHHKHEHDAKHSDTKDQTAGVPKDPVLAADEQKQSDKPVQDKAASSVGPDADVQLGYGKAEMEAIEKMANLQTSESARVQDENKNTTTGTVLNPGTSDEAIEIVAHATPASDAAIRGAKAADEQTGTEIAEGIEPAPDGHDYTSGNSITGAVAPAPFAPWDDVKAKDESAKEELVENLNLAGKAATDAGQLDTTVDATNPAEDGREKAAADSGHTTNTDDIKAESTDAAPADKTADWTGSDDSVASDNVIDFGLGSHGATPDATEEPEGEK